MRICRLVSALPATTGSIAMPARAYSHREHEDKDGPHGKQEPKRGGGGARYPAAGDRTEGGAGTHGVVAGVVPDVDQAGGAGPRRNAEKCDEADEWVEVTRRNQ